MLAQRSIDGDKDKELWSVGTFNADGFKEILLVGKYYNIEVKTTRYDAGFAGIFLGIKKIILIFFSYIEWVLHANRCERNASDYGAQSTNICSNK